MLLENLVPRGCGSVICCCSQSPTNRQLTNMSSTHPVSISDSDSDYYDSDDELELAAQREQKEWEEGLEQLQLLASVILIPVIGKYFGRRWSTWGKPFVILILAGVIISPISLCSLPSGWPWQNIFLWRESGGPYILLTLGRAG